MNLPFPTTLAPQNRITERLRGDEVPTTLYFVRHGETLLTPMRKFSGQGLEDPPLSAKGVSQAEAVAREIARRAPVALVASPLLRTQQTAAAISRATGLPLLLDEAWLELNFGEWDGLGIEDVRTHRPEQWSRWVASTAYAPPGGESYDELSVRIEAALQGIAQRHPGKRVVVVTHYAVIKVVARLAMGAPPTAVFHTDPGPCSISTVSIWPSDGLRALRSLNESAYLTEPI